MSWYLNRLYSWKYQRFTPSGWKHIGIRKSEFVTKTLFLCVGNLFHDSTVQLINILKIYKFHHTMTQHETNTKQFYKNSTIFVFKKTFGLDFSRKYRVYKNEGIKWLTSLIINEKRTVHFRTYLINWNKNWEQISDFLKNIWNFKIFCINQIELDA